MEEYRGESVYSGVAIGTIKLLEKVNKIEEKHHIIDIKAEMKRFTYARGEADKQLQLLYEKAKKEVGEVGADIFEVQRLMLEDPDYLDSIHEAIEVEKVNAEYAVAKTRDYLSNIFAMMDDDYMKERGIDIKDVSDRIITILSKRHNHKCHLESPVIIVADDLTPSETVQLDKKKVLAFVTVKGSIHSHTAILARMMNIPALVNTDISLSYKMNNRMAVVNGNTGVFYIEPDKKTMAESETQMAEENRKQESFQRLKGKENITIDGRKIEILANIGDVSDLTNVVQNDAGGIGLFRSECLYLEKDMYPTEDEQFERYKQIAEGMEGKKVIIRTLDIGADKQLDYFNIEQEENPAMGYRAIRICLDRPEIFETQLRAIFRASAFGSIAIMYPMIISLEEIRKIKVIADRVKSELVEKNVKIGNVEQGIMIETPAAVMVSDRLAAEVDFFSIGTNDLTQYTLAVDRQNQKLAYLYDSHHEAILRMIKMVVDNGHKAGIWVGICGELGADLSMTETFLRMGVDELSVAPSCILKIRDVIRHMNLKP